MKKKYIFITFMASLFLLQSNFIPTAFAQNEKSLEEIQQQRKEVQKDLTAQEKKINNLYEEIKELTGEVERLSGQMVEKEAKVESITYEIDNTIEEISILQEEIDKLNISIEERFNILKSRASSYQKSGGLINYIEVLFGAESFGDFISRLTAVNQIMDSDAALMKQLEEEMALVEEHQLTTLEKLDELNEMQAEQKAELAEIEREKKQHEQAQLDLKKKEEELVAYVKELKDEDIRLSNLEDKVKREIAEAKKREQQERGRQRSAKANNQPVQVAKVETKISNSSSKEAAASENSQKSFTVTASAYTANCNGCSGVTSTGINLRSNPNAKVIAVDPNVIPLGSLVHVEGYGYAVAGDTGSAIRGNKIDVFFPGRKSALNWGVRTVKVTVQ